MAETKDKKPDKKPETHSGVPTVPGTPLTPPSNGSATADSGVEPKDRKFRRLRDRRVPKALKVLAQVSNLASRQSYQYTGEEAAEIIDTFERAVKVMRDQFTGAAVVATGWRSKVS